MFAYKMTSLHQTSSNFQEWRFGKSVAEAWVLAYNFERACGTLLRVLQTGAEVTGIRIGFVGLLKTEKLQSYCQMLKCTDCLIVSLSYE